MQLTTLHKELNHSPPSYEYIITLPLSYRSLIAKPIKDNFDTVTLPSPLVGGNGVILETGHTRQTP